MMNNRHGILLYRKEPKRDELFDTNIRRKTYEKCLIFISFYNKLINAVILFLNLIFLCFCELKNTQKPPFQFLYFSVYFFFCVFFDFCHFFLFAPVLLGRVRERRKFTSIYKNTRNYIFLQGSFLPYFDTFSYTKT